MDRYGADSDALSDLANVMLAFEKGLDEVAATVDTSLRLCYWEGEDADRFRTEWHRHHRPSMVSVADLVSSTAVKLLSEATEQVRASAATGVNSGARLLGVPLPGLPSFPFGSEDLKSRLPGWVPLTSEDVADAIPAWLPYSPEYQLRSRFRDVILNGSPTEVNEFWWTLSPEDQSYLIERYPENVLSSDLPLSIAERQSAIQGAIDAMADDLQLTETEARLSAQGNANLAVVEIDVEAEASLKKVQLSEGETYVVEFELSGSVSKKVFGVEGAGSVTYEFHSEEEAMAFLDGLEQEVKPRKRDFLGFVPGVSSYTERVANYIDDHGNFTSARVEGGIQAGGGLGELKLAGVDVEAEATISGGGFYDRVENHYGLYVNFDAALEAEVDIGSLEGGVAFEAEARGEVVWDGDKAPSEFTFEIDASAVGQLDADDAVEHYLGIDPGFDLDVGAGRRVTIEGTINLNDPTNERLVSEFVRSGDIEKLRELAGNSNVVIQVFDHAKTGGSEINVLSVVEGSFETSYSDETNTFVKLSDGSMVEANLDGKTPQIENIY